VRSGFIEILWQVFEAKQVDDVPPIGQVAIRHRG
jgi:hypothetical protein